MPKNENLVNSFLVSIFSSFMDPLSSIFYNMAIRASASTYSQELLRSQGLHIAINTANQKVRHIGDASSPVYPEIIVWRPDYQGATTGQPVVVEAVETRDTIPASIEKWRRLANLGIRFNLVIPADQLNRVRTILREQNIPTRNLRLQTYTIQNGQYIFTTLPTTG